MRGDVLEQVFLFGIKRGCGESAEVDVKSCAAPAAPLSQPARADPGAPLPPAPATPSPGKSYVLVPGPGCTAGSCHPRSRPRPSAALRPLPW